ncbi:MAG: carboxypeptidase-like regulatory domain-containing protein [Bacteroidales bacterium]|nr:carboxypeptidase-like regulatory domain-containing protein [Bacteroidales bacterium]
MYRKLLLIWVILAGSLATTAQWSTNPAVNNTICNLAGEQAIPKVAVCPNGDTYIGFFSNEAGNYNVRLQRLDVLGNTQWAANGILVSNNTQETWLTDWDMTADPSNHAILVFNDIRNGNTNVYAYRIAPDGTFVWGANGVALSNNTAFNAAPKVIATTAGNIVAAWMSDEVIIMQKINPAGALQWGANGITISGTNTRSWPQMLPVGTDEFIMKYYDDSGAGWSPTRHVYAQKYNSAGAAVWASPATISTAGGISAQTQILPFINDGSDGFYIAWDDDRDNNLLANSFVQHVNASGQTLFATNGVAVSTEPTMNHWYPELALPTGSQEVYVFWNEINGNQNQWGIYAQKFSSAGVRQWTDNGKVLIGVSSSQYYPLAGSGTPTDMVLFVEEYATSINGYLKAMRVDAAGNFVWTPFLKPICTVNSQKVHTNISKLQNSQWIVAWEDTRGIDSDIYAQNLSLDGTNGPVEFGTIAGTITLNGGFGNMTDVVVQAGTNTTHPNASGAYTLNVTTGTYTVTASLSGYASASQNNVAVTLNQTSTVNLTLQANPVAMIEGTVTLLNGVGQVWNTTVKAGAVTTNPDVNGHYSLLVTPGTYDVVASLPLYTPDTAHSVLAVINQITTPVDLELSLAPTTGFLSGHVSLNGGTGVVTDVEVNAGGNIANPDATGFWTMEVPVGNYDVMAILTGYGTQFQMGTPVVAGQTTSNVDFVLTPVANIAYITGNVTVNGTIQNITDVVVEAGNNTTHPDAQGNYTLEVASGSWDVTASHDYTDTQTINNITLQPGQTATGIDFTLAQIRTDLVCLMTSGGYPIYDYIEVAVTGPEQTYTGTTTTAQIMFEKALFGFYHGEAFNYMYLTSAEDTINATTNTLTFDFPIAIAERENTLAGAVMPNPLTAGSSLHFTLHEPQALVTLTFTDITGRSTTLLESSHFEAGANVVPLGNYIGQLAPGIYLLTLKAGNQTGQWRVMIAN